LFGCAEHPRHDISDRIANRFKNKVEDRLSEGNMKSQLSHGVAARCLSPRKLAPFEDCYLLPAGGAHQLCIALRAYLREVLQRIADHPVNRIEELLPWNLGPAIQPVSS
jgi:hypothetical protein